MSNQPTDLDRALLDEFTGVLNDAQRDHIAQLIADHVAKQLAAMTTLCAKLREAMERAKSRAQDAQDWTSFHSIAKAIALTPAAIADQLAQKDARIVLPAQTTGDGTSAGALSVFARGWNGYHHELIKLNPGMIFDDCPLVESHKYLGDTSLQKRAEQAEKRINDEIERGKGWCTLEIEQRKRAEKAEQRAIELTTALGFRAECWKKPGDGKYDPVLDDAKALRPEMFKARQRVSEIEGSLAFWFDEEFFRDRAGPGAPILLRLWNKAKEMEQQRDAAIHERKCCHEIYDEIRRTFGYPDGVGYPMLTQEAKKIMEQLKEARVDSERLTEFIDQLASQKLENEMDEETKDDADYEGAYDEIILMARRLKAARKEGA